MKQRILIIDDDLRSRAAIKTVLAGFAFEMVEGTTIGFEFP